MAHPLDTNDVLTPDEVVRQLNEVSRWASGWSSSSRRRRRTCGCVRRSGTRRARRRCWTSPGTRSGSARARVTLATREERRMYDAAVVAYEEARRVGNLLKEHSMRLQSIGKLVSLTYQHGAS